MNLIVFLFLPYGNDKQTAEPEEQPAVHLQGKFLHGPPTEPLLKTGAAVVIRQRFQIRSHTGAAVPLKQSVIAIQQVTVPGFPHRHLRLGRKPAVNVQKPPAFSAGYRKRYKRQRALLRRSPPSYDERRRSPAAPSAERPGVAGRDLRRQRPARLYQSK